MPIPYYDLVIVGSGPAGLIAAIESYHVSQKTIILEKMPRPALKLRISGKGRCNITNDAELNEFISRFGINGRFLKYPFREFFNTDLINYLEKMGIEFKLERGGRYFPQSDKAIEIVNALIRKLNALKIPIATNSEVLNIAQKKQEYFLITVKKKTDKGDKGQKVHYYSKKILIATGGKSYPRTGSTGQGYKLAKDLGHSITPVFPALVPLETKGERARSLQGLSLKNVKVNVWCQNKKIDERFGEMLFTDSGLSGPIVLAISKTVVKLIRENQNVKVTIDLKPALDVQAVDRRLLREINQHGKQSFASLLKKLLPQKMIPVFIEILEVSRDSKLSQISAETRKNLKLLLKEFPFEISDHGSYDEAIVTTGGVNIQEINSKTMESKMVEGLYFAGEVIDIDADTGGYNLQAAFSTGWVAGQAIKKNI